MQLKKRSGLLMEANNKGGEIRRVHILYFLSRMGHVEQPHLIRVHHLAAAATATAVAGVFLRDVKRWLGELRGKEMPEAFSWSYKRKYKTGYVWQDLVDDDLITPFSDNEYVLQGSQIIQFPSLFHNSGLTCSSSKQRKNSVFRSDELEPTRDFPAKLQMNGESPPCDSERSTVTDDGDSIKVEEETKNFLETAKQGIGVEEIEGFNNQYSSLYEKLKEEKYIEKDKMEKEGGPTATSTVSSSSSSSSSSTHPAFTKSKSYSSGASHVLRQWITCGAVDTNDTVLIKNRSAAKDPPNLPEKPKNDAVICRDDMLGGSARVLRSSWDGQLDIHRHNNQQNSRKSFDELRKKRPKESGGRKVAAATAAFKAMGGPNCSQCGKSFKPEKMHAHMKSCRGLKSLLKTPSTSNKTTSSKSTTTTTSHNYFLTN